QHEPLGSVVGRMKSASGVHANRVLARTGPVWEPAFHDHALRRDEDLRSVARYIIANPVRAGLVDRPGDYPFWDCIWMQEPAASPPPLLQEPVPPATAARRDAARVRPHCARAPPRGTH